MIKVHHLEDSRSQRVLWLLEKLEIKYRVIRYERDPKTNLAPKELMEIHPLGKSPLIEDDGIIFAETGAIFEYLLDKYDPDFKWHPAKTDPRYRDYIYYLHFAEGSLMPPLVITKILSVVDEKVPFFMKPIAALITGAIRKNYLAHTIGSLFDYLEGKLVHDYFLGSEISAVDIMMSFPLEASVAGRVDLAKRPRIVSFVKRIKEDNAYKKALEVGGPYSY